MLAADRVRRELRGVRRARAPRLAAGRRPGPCCSPTAAWPLLFVGVTAIAWVFPDGRLPSPRWRPWALGAARLVRGAWSSCRCSRPSRFERAVPRRHQPAAASCRTPSLGIPLALCGARRARPASSAARVAVRARLRRATGIERLQLKWLAYAAALVPAARGGLRAGESPITGERGRRDRVAARAVALTAIPAGDRRRGAALPPLRDRPADQPDARLRRADARCSPRPSPRSRSALGVAVGSGSTLPTAAATLAVALAVRAAARARAALVDRRFDRARYEGLRHGRALPRGAARRARGARGDRRGAGRGARRSRGSSCCFWLPTASVARRRARAAWSSGAGRRAARARRCGAASLPLGDGRPRPGAGASARTCSTASIDAAGLAIEIARLRVEVRRQLAEVEASRARIVTAGYEERRRLERDLHDGAQQRLVSIGLALRHVQGRLPGDADRARALDATVAELARAIDELRELARGVRPGRPRRRARARAARARGAVAAADRGRRDRASASTTRRDRRLLRRQRGAHQRRQARARVAR